MVKAYLRYEHGRSIGVISSRECNVVYDNAGKHALTGAVEVVNVWNLRQGTLVRSLRAAKSLDRVVFLCARPEAKNAVAVGYSDGTVRIWDFEAGEVLHTFQGHRSSISCLAFDHEGHILASGANDTDIVLWDITAEAGVARLRGHVDQVTAVLFWQPPSAEGGPGPAARLISASKDRIVRIWSIEMQICLQTIAEHQVEVWSLALNAAKTHLAAGSADKFLRLWNLAPEASGEDDSPIATYLGEVPRPNGQGSALALQFVKPAELSFEVLLCQGAGKVLEVFRCFEDTDMKRRQKRRKRRAEIKKQKKKAGEAAEEGEKDEEEEGAEEAGEAAKEEEVEQGTRAADRVTELLPHRFTTKVASMSCTPTGRMLLGMGNNTIESVRLLPNDAEATPVKFEGMPGLELPGHRTAVRSLAMAHDDSLLMSTSAEACKIWNVATGHCIRTMASGYGLCGMFLAGNEHVLLGTKEGKLELYDLSLGELVQETVAHTGAIYGLAEAPDQKGFVSCAADKFLRSFDLRFEIGKTESVSFTEVTEKATELADECLAVAYAKTGKWIVVALLNHTIQLLFADTLKFYLSLYGHKLPVLSVDISSDAQMVASGSADKNVKVWSTQFGNCHKSMRAHDDSVMQVRFLPGTHYLATVGRDRELKLWDCDTYELITALKGHSTEILSLALSQDAAFIATAGSDRQIRFWKRSSEQLFLSEERTKELEDNFEAEAEREDLPGPNSEVVTLRPSRRTIESIRSTEQLMEILDEGIKAEKEGVLETVTNLGPRHPCSRVLAYVNTLNASNVYEVLLALPFSHAVMLLNFICRFFEAVSSLPGPDGAEKASDKNGDAHTAGMATTMETPCQVALITAYVHHHELASTPSVRPMLLRLRAHMRRLLQAEKDQIGIGIAGFTHLHRSLKRASGGAALFGAAPPAGGASAKKKQKQ